MDAFLSLKSHFLIERNDSASEANASASLLDALATLAE
jgi:hypothetical protein